MNELDQYAFCYTATEKGNNSGIKFMMSIEDAQRWCSNPVSKGNLHGTNWAYFYTSVRNFIECHWGTNSPKIDLRKCIDNNSWDDRIVGAECTKIGLNEVRHILSKYGITVLR